MNYRKMITVSLNEQELCAIKSIYLNRPKQKDCNLFSETEKQRYFKIIFA